MSQNKNEISIKILAKAAKANLRKMNHAEKCENHFVIGRRFMQKSRKTSEISFLCHIEKFMLKKSAEPLKGD
jgi:hypothetical protein